MLVVVAIIVAGGVAIAIAHHLIFRDNKRMDEIIIVIEEECGEHHPHHHTPKLDRIESKINKILALLRPHPQASRQIEFTNPLVTTNPEGTKETRTMAINVTPNDTIEGGLTVKDADGDVLSGSTVAFASSDTAVLGVVDNGDGTYKATAVALGDAAIQATVGGDVPISLALDVHVQTGPAVAATFGDPVITTVDAPPATPPI